MNVRYSVGLLFVAVGGLMALLGALAFVNPGGVGPGFRAGCGGAGAVGVLVVGFGLRLRNRAVAASPELKRALDNPGPTVRTGAAKPSFLQTEPAPDPSRLQPEKPPGGLVAYFVLCLVFGAAVLAAGTAALNLFPALQQFKDVLIAVGVLLALVVPTVWMIRARRAAEEGGSDGTDGPQSPRPMP